MTALDLRGCGLSDQPAEGYGIPELADDVAGVCAAADITKPIVIGHSHGDHPAQAVPDQISAMIERFLAVSL